MNTPTHLESVGVERVKADEKKIVMVPALQDRIRQHEAGYRLAQARITACMDLKVKCPNQADVLNAVIDVWMRVRAHHSKVAEASRELLASIATREPDEH